MSAHELRARSRAVFTQYCEEASHRLGVERNPDLDLLPEASSAVFSDPWIDPDEQRALVETLRAKHPEYVSEIVQEADALCRHEFALFGIVARFGPSIAWQADPVSGNQWPSDFHTRVRIFDGNSGNGDVKYVWELSRHQFLPVLGKAYRLTNDEKYAAKGLELLESWIDANPCNIGINWTSALEVAVRSLAWCSACALFEGSPSLTPALRRRILGSFAQHARYIERHLSFYFSPYNHLIGEATALFVIGSLVPSLRRAAHWRDRGWAILESEMPKQYHQDGGTVEQASGYHHFTLGFHLHATLVRRRTQVDTAGPMWTTLEKAIEFSMQMMRPDGSLPMIGDGDEGKAIPLVQRNLWDFRVFLAIGAALFGRGDFKKMAGPFPPDGAWLIGASGLTAHEILRESLPEATSQALAASGYYIMRTGWDSQAHYLGFDCGELAAGVATDETVSAAHGHADTLAIEVSAFGEPLLVDPGFWTYNGAVEWHRYFRETEAHNTVVVDGRSQAEFRGRLKWSNAPQAEAHEWITLGALDYADGSHSGYRRLPSPVIHRRTVVFLKPHYWLVRDELAGEGGHALDRCFHFATSEVTRDGVTNAVQTRAPNGRPNLAVIPVERDDLAVEVVRGGPASPVGWLAVGYERKVQAASAKFRTTSVLPCAFHTVLMPFRGDSPRVRVTALPIESNAGSPLPTASGSPSPGFGVVLPEFAEVPRTTADAGRRGAASERQRAGVAPPRLNDDRAFDVSRPGGRDIWAFSSGTIAQFHDGWVTDARTTCVQLNESGDVIGCVLVSGSTVEVDGEPLITLDRRVRAATFSIVDGRPVIELSEQAKVVACAFEHVVRKAC